MSEFPVAFKPLAQLSIRFSRQWFVWLWPRFVCRYPATRRTGGPCGDLSPCPRRLQDIGLAFRWTTGWIFIWSCPLFVYRSTADRRNGGRHGQLSAFLLGHATCLHCPQVSSRPQAIRPAFHLTILSLLGCGLYYGVLSGVFRYLLV